ncbi:MAG: glycoside hydrolase family 2 TIM barrel-domain containing protein [Clostridia bacterium]|jgi:beta-glucuronidase
MIEQISLNSFWKFRLDRENIGKTKEWFRNTPENVVDMYVPSCWNEADDEWLHYEGVAWYFKEFHFKKNDEIKRNVLFFNGVNYMCEVWLNGQFAGSHTGGFTPFEIDVTNLLKANQENTLAVRVDSTISQFTVPPIGVDWFNYGGITREVYLNGTGESWIDDVFVKTKINGEIDIKLQLGGYKKQDGDQVHIEILDRECAKTMVESYEIILNENPTIGLHIENPNLWSPDSPYLYNFEISLLRKGKIIDRWTHKIGVREFSKKDRRIYLNNKPIMLKGYSKHEEYHQSARTFSYDLVRKDYEMCKKGNANFLRLCHYPHDLKEYEMASEMGFIVMAEVPNVDFKKAHFENKDVLQNSINQAKEALKYYKNETCIMFWSLFIECNTNEEAAVDFVPKYIKLFKDTDPTRMTIHASVIPMQDKTYDYFDIVGINYWNGWYFGQTIEEGKVFLDDIAKNYPDKPVIITSGGWEGIYGYHSYKKNEFWSEEQQAQYLEDMTNLYLSKDYIVGEIIWTFNDFRTSPWYVKEKGSNRFMLRPMELNHKGVVDSFRRPKLAYYKMQEVFKKWNDKK